MVDSLPHARLLLSLHASGHNVHPLFQQMVGQHTGAARQERPFRFDEPSRPAAGLQNRMVHDVLTKLVQGS